MEMETCISKRLTLKKMEVKGHKRVWCISRYSHRKSSEESSAFNIMWYYNELIMHTHGHWNSITAQFLLSLHNKTSLGCAKKKSACFENNIFVSVVMYILLYLTNMLCWLTFWVFFHLVYKLSVEIPQKSLWWDYRGTAEPLPPVWLIFKQ